MIAQFVSFLLIFLHIFNPFCHANSIRRERRQSPAQQQQNMQIWEQRQIRQQQQIAFQQQQYSASLVQREQQYVVPQQSQPQYPSVFPQPIQPQFQQQIQPIQPIPGQPSFSPSQQSSQTSADQNQYPSQNGQIPPQTTPRRGLSAYDEHYARTMLALSAGAYARNSGQTQECINRWMPDAQLWRIFTSTNMSCDILDNPCSSYIVVSESRQEMVVVFRGTKSKEQLFLEGWQSLQPGKDFYGIGKVNGYFLHALMVMWPSIQSALSDARHTDFKVTFTGHSLGGALASLAALRTVLNGIRRIDQIKLYTFGQPRVGDPSFAFRHDQLIPESYRIVHRMDIVPHMPACAKNERYPGVQPNDDSKPCDPSSSGPYHHGTEIWYPYGMNSGDPYFECVGEPRNEDFHCSDAMSFEMTKYKTYIADHRHYFGHKVPAWGKLGCAPNSQVLEEKMPNGTDEPVESQTSESSNGQKSTFRRLVTRVKTLGKAFGHIF